MLGHPDFLEEGKSRLPELSSDLHAGAAVCTFLNSPVTQIKLNLGEIWALWNMPVISALGGGGRKIITYNGPVSE